MGHVPHLYLPGPWPDGPIPLDDAHRDHLRRVLRRGGGDPVTYTDGAGRVGTGTLAEEAVERGGERLVPPPPSLTLAVAPPAAKDRARFLVEKLAELGVARLEWLRTRRGEGRVPRPDRAEAWAVAALEQSRGAWLTRVAGSEVSLAELEGKVVAADAGGGPLPEGEQELVVAIGPEGGWDPGELPPGTRRVTLGPRVLRVETAALVAATRLLAADALREFGHAEW